MTRIRSCLLTALLMFGAVVSSRAGLTLIIDTTNEEFYFTGTDSGTTNASGLISWSSGDGIAGASYDLDISSALTFSGFSPTTVEINFEASGPDVVISASDFLASPSTPFSVTGNGTRISFNTFLISSEKTEFYAVSSLPFSSGAGAGPIMVAVPEPSTYAAILGLVTLGLVVHRRRNAAQAK